MEKGTVVAGCCAYPETKRPRAIYEQPSLKPIMDHEARFAKLWAGWDKRIDDGETPGNILRNSKDEDLVEVLGGESDLNRKYARDIIATELLNRLHIRSSKHPAAAKAAQASAKLAHEAAKEGQEAIHHAEGLLKNSGQYELGAAVSASAYKSLDASEAAFTAAKEHAEALHETLAQSRVGDELAKEAASAAEVGRKITHKLGEQMENMGKGKEGRAAKEASLAIKTTADQAATDAKSPDQHGRP